MPSPVAPRFNMIESCILNAINAVKPVLGAVSIPDEAGNPLVVPMRSIYSNLDATFSEVVVGCNPGRIQQGPGLNVLRWDDVNSVYDAAVYAPNAQISFSIKGRNDPERLYIMDTLLSGICGAYGVLSTGEVVEAAVIKTLATAGIIPIGFETDIPHTDLGEPRPEGQVYPCVLTMLAQVWMSWSLPGITTNTIHIQTTATTWAPVPQTLGTPWATPYLPLTVVDSTLTV